MIAGHKVRRIFQIPIEALLIDVMPESFMTSE